jgi:hypothetical protein
MIEGLTPDLPLPVHTLAEATIDVTPYPSHVHPTDSRTSEGHD